MEKQEVREDYKIAIACEPLYKQGGAELHLKYIIEAFPNCEVFTAYYDEKFVKEFYPNVKIHHSFMQYLPKKDSFRELYLLLQPLAYKSFKLNSFDVVISLSIAFAKYVKAKGIKHIDLCMSPPKFLWMKESRSIREVDHFTGIKKYLFKIYSFFMDSFVEDLWRKWDREASRSCYKIAAISNVVKERIKKFYNFDADVIYPPVEVTKITKRKHVNRKENWFLYVGRVETYKGVELAIRACVKLGLPLKVAGSGGDLERMHSLVKDLNAKGLIKILGYVNDEEKFNLLQRAKAVIFPVRDEDFGIVPVEANAFGTPVIAYRGGGVLETISERNPKTGIFFDEYTVDSLIKALKSFKPERYTQDNCRKQATNFASEIFVYKLQNYVKDALQNN